jgi:hypothetical protein
MELASTLTGERRAAPRADALGRAYSELRAALVAIQGQLGGGVFAQRCVTRAARDAFNRLRRLGSRNEPFTECFTCTPAEMRAVTLDVKSRFAIRRAPATYASAPMQSVHGRVVLRELLVFFETSSACVVLGHAFDINAQFGERPPGTREKWCVATTDELADLALAVSKEKPKVTTIYVKTREAAIKSLLRIARDNLGQNLKPVMD